MNTLCKRCGQIIKYEAADTWWDFTGSNYNTKLTKCPLCESMIILEYEDEPKRDRWDIKKGSKYGI